MLPLTQCSAFGYDTQFSLTCLHTNTCLQEVDIGIAADMGTLSRIGKIIGNDSLARELAFTARPFRVDEAIKMGFVSRVEESHQATVDAALTVAELLLMSF
jgi:delta(3,5)-delta(2,4)-dienoyl-CoA isomerase